MNLNSGNAVLKDETLINTGERKQSTQLFHLLMERVFLKDKKNVLWDGRKASVFVDKTKGNSITQSNMIHFDYKLINYFEEWSTMFVDSNGLKFTKDKLVSRAKEDYYLLDDKFYFRIKKVNFDQTIDKLLVDVNFIDVTSTSINERLEKRFKNIMIYRGIITEEEKQYAGFRAVVDGYSEQAYELSYFSIGNMAEICKSAYGFINGFCDSFF